MNISSLGLRMLARALAVVLGFAGGTLLACNDSDNGPVTDSRSGNWGLACETSGECEGVLSCECGVCTRACEASCPDTLQCVDVAAVAACGASTEGSLCLERCVDATDCAAGDAAACSGGVCSLLPITGTQCTLVAPAASQEWSVIESPQPVCDCDELNPSCRDVFEMRVTAINNLNVTVQVRSAAGVALDDAIVTRGVAVGVRESLSCWDPESLSARVEAEAGLRGDWEVIVPVLAEPGEFDAIPAGATVWLHSFAGSAANPTLRVYHSLAGLALQKQCL